MSGQSYFQDQLFVVSNKAKLAEVEQKFKEYEKDYWVSPVIDGKVDFELWNELNVYSALSCGAGDVMVQMLKDMVDCIVGYAEFECNGALFRIVFDGKNVLHKNNPEMNWGNADVYDIEDGSEVE